MSSRVLGWEYIAVKKAAKKAVRKVNREGKRWTDDSSGMTLRLPIDLREAITEESRVKGDLAKIVLFALDHIDRENVKIMQTCKAGMELSNPQLLHVGAQARLTLKEWAEAEGVSVNAIVVSFLQEFFNRLKRSKALSEVVPVVRTVFAISLVEVLAFAFRLPWILAGD